MTGRRGDIGGAEADQFLVRGDALAPFGREGLRHRNGFDEADDGDDEGRQQQRLDGVELEARQGQHRQALRHLTHQRDTLAAKVEQRCGEDGREDDQHRSRPHEQRRQTLGEAEAEQPVPEVQPDPEQQPEGPQPHRQCVEVEFHGVAGQ